jgi:chemotaxis protein methyltransferase CheR
MIATLDGDAIDRFAALIAQRLGLFFDDDKRDFLAEVLSRAARERKLDRGAYLDRLTQSDAEWRLLAPALTVTETYFFRNAAQFAALRETLATQPEDRPTAILSAGCASGEEPYSIAMVLAEAGIAPPAIHAIDINPAMLAKAAAGRYSAWSLRETDMERRARNFTAVRDGFVLDAGIRNAVTFAEGNLADADGAWWRNETFAAVFCRNVLMYFTPPAARAAIARIARCLVPGGLLFLGHAETLRGLSRDFDLRHTHGTFYYRRKDALTSAEDDDAEADPLWAKLPRAPDGAGRGIHWYELIEGATSRVRRIAARPIVAASDPPPQPAPVARATALLAEERYGEALTLLASLPADEARDPETMFLRGVLLMHRGDIAAAERICTALLLRDGASAGAHYLMALCREAGGYRAAAALHDRHAATLDPNFALPRLHIGLMARRNGDEATARRELARAFTLLAGEQEARLMLFGGGFGREALRALCQAELAAAAGLS